MGISFRPGQAIAEERPLESLRREPKLSEMVTVYRVGQKRPFQSIYLLRTDSICSSGEARALNFEVGLEVGFGDARRG